MVIDIQALDELYQRYGYKKENTSADLRVYLYEQGRYFGADIIPLIQENSTLENCELLRKEYSNGGYAAKIKEIKTVENAANELYKSFFSYDSTLARLKSKYKSFKKNQEWISGGNNYKYIHSPYQLNNDPPHSSINIIENIGERLKLDTPQLIIIEAAAGYGKTCTSYELLKELTNNGNCDNPIITELSRNRGANIFRYVLLDEIDREYPTLDSTLVKNEIYTGRIPLIIDGFDELLNKSDLVTDQENEVFGEIEPMLDTIGKMLIGKAKLILTTRKTAIFGGSEFRDWYSKWSSNFSVSRFSIEIPRIKDWLGSERVSQIKNKDIPIEQIANPVLLTYLKNLNDTEFNTHLLEPELIVKKYFYSLMAREKVRQELYIDPEDQYTIFKNVAELMLEFDLSSEKRQFMKDVIADGNRDILEKALKAYPGAPNMDMLTDKLVNHAIFDRKGHQENMIGFINDFIFGSFIGEIMCESSIEKIEKDFSAYMVELGATAYRVQNKTNKDMLWAKIESLKHKFPINVMFNFDITLKSRLLRNVDTTTIQSIQVYQVDFTGDYKIKSTAFINCKFKNCNFNIKAFNEVSFIQCSFENCNVIGAKFLDLNSENNAIKCEQSECEIFYYNSDEFYEKEYSEDEIFRYDLLKKIMNLEKDNKSKKLTLIMKSYTKGNRKKVNQEIEALSKEKFIVINGLDIHISMNKLKEVESKIDAL